MALTEGIGGFLSASAALPTTFDAAGFSTMTFIEISEITEVPEHGGVNAVVGYTPLRTGLKNKFHGERDNGSLTIPIAFDPTDDGQNLVRDAWKSKDEISLQETFSDGSAQYFLGKVFGFTVGQSVGSVNMGNLQIEITSEIVPAV